MAQRLIVEGNDAIALAALCKKRGLQPPIGYESESKFKDEFVKNSGGYDKTLRDLRESLSDNSLTNIGIIVDANEVGASARWQAIRAVLAEEYAESVLETADRQTGPKIIAEDKLATVGVWIMPDNDGTGYLEHFLAELVPSGDALWQHTLEVIEHLQIQKFCELRSSRIGKARLHTWLAWKENPGKPFGQAISSRYFDINAPTVQPFLDWYCQYFPVGGRGS